MPETSENWLDRMLSAVAPVTYARRVMARNFLASYRGGIATRTDRSFGQSNSYRLGTSGDRLAIRNMRDRARKVFRDSALGRSLLQTETDNVIAEGMTLQARTGEREFDAEAEEKFSAWMDVADIRGMLSGGELQRTIYLGGRRDGDIGVVLVDRGGESRLQIIPGDLIRTPDGKANGPDLVDGVEVDALARPIAFHILDQDEFGKRSFTRVPASNFIFLSHTSDALQVRGESCYTTIFPLLDQIDAYRDAVIIAARMACVFGLIFKESNPQNSFNPLNTIQNSQGVQQKGITIENGMARYVGKDSDVVQVQAQQPMNQTPDFIRAMVRDIGVAFDMPLEIAYKDVSQSNLSSLRGAKQDYYRSCRSRQLVFRKRLLSRVYQWWISREVKLGRFAATVPEKFWPHEFLPRGWQFSDPVKEVAAAMAECDAGFNSPQNVIAALGRDPSTVILQNQKWREDCLAAGLPMMCSTMTRDPGTTPATQPADNKNTDDEFIPVDPEAD